MPTVPVRELRNNTAEILRRVQAGSDVTITHNGVPVAELSPIRRPRRGPMRTADLLRLIDRRPPDPTFAADIAALTGDTTDDLRPLR